MGVLATKIGFEAMKTIDSATFTGSYQVVGTVTSNEARAFCITNNSNKAVTFSLDGGTTDHMFLPANTFRLYDIASNRSNNAPYLALAKGTQFMAKGSAGTGLVYIELIFGDTPSQTLPL